MGPDYPANALPVNYRLGEYVIKRVLGHGGFGITYLARDSRLDTQVAIKEYFPDAFAIRDKRTTIRPRTGSSTADAENYRWGLKEFLKEARVLAKFKHNHIVRVLRFLEANGTAYMVMEYEEGQNLAGYLRQHRGFLSESKLLQVFLPILSGLQAVHEAGLLHLDIKPGNIYLRANGQPMLIDFGSSQQVKGHINANQKIALTTGYSALEHYPGQGEQGPWTDVYSMGATIYRCITGKEPVDVMKRYQAVNERGADIITPATEFTRPFYSKHIRECVDKAMQIKQEDRPQSAAALQNGLMGKPMTEDSSTFRYRIGSGFIGVIPGANPNKHSKKYTKRGFLEKLIVFLVFLATVAVVTPKLLVDTFVITDAELYDELDKLKLKADKIKTDARNYIDERIFGKRPVEKVKPKTAAMVSPERKSVVNPVEAFSVAKVTARILEGHAKPVVSLAFLSSDTMLVSASNDGVIKIWEVESGKLLETLRSSAEAAGVITASRDGRWLAIPDDGYIIRLFNVADKTQTGELLGHRQHINALAFSPDGKILASAGEDNIVSVWDVENQRKIADLKQSTDNVLALEFSPNGRILVTGDSKGGIRYWDVATWKELAYTSAGKEAVTTLAFSSKGNWLASGGEGNQLKLWQIGIKRNDRVLKGAPDTVHTVRFSPDEKQLILGGTTGAIQIWSVETGEIIHRLNGHNNNVRAVAISRDGKILASGGDDYKVKIWE